MGSWISEIVDQALDKMMSQESEWAMMTPRILPKEMIDESRSARGEYQKWKPITSTITNAELDLFERKIGLKLPPSYRAFLQYKYFVEIDFPNRAINFPANMPDKRLGVLEDYIFNYHEPELIIGKGYIYFADFEDYGLLCFDTNISVPDGEYPVVFINHEELEDIHPYCPNFRSLLESGEEHPNAFIDYLNEFYAE